VDIQRSFLQRVTLNLTRVTRIYLHSRPDPCYIASIPDPTRPTHDILVGMSWMQAHGAAHHVHISCAARALGFWPNFWSRDCTEFTAYNQHHICCTSTLHADIASLANMDMLNMLTCNQFKKFLKDDLLTDLDVETCAVFVKNTLEALPLLAIEEDLGRAQTLANIDVTLEAMRARVT
jgi:hypothetical protein